MDDDGDVTRRNFFRQLGALGIGLGASSLLSAQRAVRGRAGCFRSTAASDLDGAKTVTIRPVDDKLKYEKTEFTVPAQKNVKIVFKNTAASLKHNVVVLKRPPRQKFFRRVGQAGLQAGAENDYVPSGHPAVLAATPLSKPGETVEVAFTTPTKAGDYGYVCTYPGHWVTMQGTMHVEK